MSKLKKIFALLFLTSLVLAACAPAGQNGAPILTTVTPIAATPTVAMPTDAPPNVPVPAPTSTVQSYPVHVQAVVEDAVKMLNVSASEIKVTQIEAVQWTDSCLGLGGPAESCLQVMTDGFRVIVEANGRAYEYHTNQDGSQVRSIEIGSGSSNGGPTNPDMGNLPKAVTNARDTLAQQLMIRVEDIKVVKFEQVDWPNGCLGIEVPGRMCTQVITPGYRVILEAGGQQFEFRTDLAGGAVVKALAPLPHTLDKALTWEQTQNNACRRVEIGVKTVGVGECGGSLNETALDPARQEDLRVLLGTYASFSGATQAGSVSLNGSGSQEATAAEQRSLAAWAKLVAQEAEAGGGDLEWFSALSFSRVGGIAGFCDDLIIYQTGWAVPSSCKSNAGNVMKPFRLSADQLERLYEWIDRFQRFEYNESSPPGVSDAMTVKLVLKGLGSETASAQLQGEIANFASEIFTLAPK